MLRASTNTVDHSPVSDGASSSGRPGLPDLLYDELRRIAARYLRRERRDHTLQPTALVHEAFARLADASSPLWNDRVHFLSLAAVAMRRVLVDHARRRGAAKRGFGRHRTTMSVAVDTDSEAPVDLLALDEALRALSRLNQRHSRMVELRYFGGLTVEQTAEVLGVSPRTVELDWRMARAWLRRALELDADQ